MLKVHSYEFQSIISMTNSVQGLSILLDHFNLDGYCRILWDIDSCGVSYSCQSVNVLPRISLRIWAVNSPIPKDT